MAGQQVRPWIEQAVQTLTRAGVDSPRADAELLLAHVLDQITGGDH